MINNFAMIIVEIAVYVKPQENLAVTEKKKASTRMETKTMHVTSFECRI
jgi:hypothetical protein